MKHRAPDPDRPPQGMVKPVSDQAASLFLFMVALLIAGLFVGFRMLFL